MQITEVAGRGVRAVVDGAEIAVGNATLMRELGVDVRLPNGQGTVLFVSRSGTYLGAILISDTVKAGAREAVAALSRLGVKRTVMLTGDRKESADRVASALDISEWRAELLPADKVRAVEELLRDTPEKATLLFVGDGINDAPVLARADVGVAMGAFGSDAAIDASDVVLMDDKPTRIAEAIRIARRTVRIVRQNIAFAIGIKVLVMVLAAFGAASLWLAVFADVGVAVIAILNAMRAMRS